MAPWNAQNTSAPNQFWYTYVINGFVQNWTNYVYQTLFGKWLKDVEGSRQHLLRCTAAHFKNMRMVFDTTFCGDFPASSVQLFKHAMKIYEKDEHVANFWKHGLSFPDSGDYAGASFNTYCGWTHMQCEAYVRSKPNDFRRWDCSSWVESNWYVMRSSWAEGWNINLWKVATQSDNQFGWFDMIFHGCFRHSCQIRLCVLSPTYHTRGNAYWGIRRLVFRQENFRRKDLWKKGMGSVQPVASLTFPLCKSIFESCNIIRMVKVIVMIIGDEYSLVICMRCIFVCVH